MMKQPELNVTTGLPMDELDSMAQDAALLGDAETARLSAQRLQNVNAIMLAMPKANSLGDGLQRETQGRGPGESPAGPGRSPRKGGADRRGGGYGWGQLMKRSAQIASFL